MLEIIGVNLRLPSVLVLFMMFSIAGMIIHPIEYSEASTSDEEDEDVDEDQQGSEGEDGEDSSSAGPTGPQPGSQGQTPGTLTGPGAQNIQTLEDLISMWDDSLVTGEMGTLLFTGPTTWIATGDWKMLIADGDVKSFDSDMVWYNANGSSSHTHEISNFEWDGDLESTGDEDEQEEETDQGDSSNEAVQGSNSSGTSPPIPGVPPSGGASIILTGEADVGTNGETVWTGVPTTIRLGGEKVLSILLDDAETDSHFARQPMYGVVSSVTPCSDSPGANMQVLQPCE